MAQCGRPITREKAMAFARYDPETGIFYRVRPTKSGWSSGAAFKGTVDNRGYLKINCDRMPISAHRLAWLLMTGEWPMQQIDHINRNKLDNSWCNLRLATSSQNTVNRKLEGVWPRGVTKSHNRSKPFKAALTVNYKRRHLGYFATPEEACLAYEEAARIEFGEFLPQ